MSFVARAWKGEEKLWKVFWGGGLIWPLLIISLTFLITIFLFPGRESEAAAFPLLIIALSYFLWWPISVWRCAKNTNSNYWGIAARWSAPAFLLAVVAAFIVNSLYSSGNNIECKKIRTDAGDLRHKIEKRIGKRINGGTKELMTPEEIDQMNEIEKKWIKHCRIVL